jgi:hypothetical protein
MAQHERPKAFLPLTSLRKSMVFVKNAEDEPDVHFSAQCGMVLLRMIHHEP